MGKQRRKNNKMKKYTLKEIKKLWHFAYNEDLAKEYKGFFKLLKRKAAEFIYYFRYQCNIFKIKLFIHIICLTLKYK
jgi:hypothetical protein